MYHTVYRYCQILHVVYLFMDTLFCLLLSFFLFLFFTDEEEELHLHHNDRETEGTKNLRKNGKGKKN